MTLFRIASFLLVLQSGNGVSSEDRKGFLIQGFAFPADSIQGWPRDGSNSPVTHSKSSEADVLSRIETLEENNSIMNTNIQKLHEYLRQLIDKMGHEKHEDDYEVM